MDHRDRHGLITGPARILHMLLLFIVVAIGFDTLFELGNANPSNAFVGLVDSSTEPFLAPFAAMFGGTAVLMPAAVAAIVYLVLDGTLSSLIRRANEQVTSAKERFTSANERFTSHI